MIICINIEEKNTNLITKVEQTLMVVYDDDEKNVNYISHCRILWNVICFDVSRVHLQPQKKEK